jgi:hypothetical protein
MGRKYHAEARVKRWLQRTLPLPASATRADKRRGTHTVKALARVAREQPLAPHPHQ